MRMPFGKYKGKPIYDVPSAYLCWLIENTDLFPQTRDAVFSELKRRFDDARWHLHAAMKALGIPYRWEQSANTREAVHDWLDDLAREYHSDNLQGNAVVQSVLADAAERLKKRLKID